jgi:hypothetical protein
MCTQKQERKVGLRQTLLENQLVTIAMVILVNKNTEPFSGRLFHLFYSFGDPL